MAQVAEGAAQELQVAEGSVVQLLGVLWQVAVAQESLVQLPVAVAAAKSWLQHHRR